MTTRAAAPTMPYQRSLTIVAPVREGAENEVESLLATMGDGVANGSVIDFGALDGVHFARLMMAPADTDHVRRAAARERDPAQRLRRAPWTLSSSSWWRPRARASIASSGTARATRRASRAARDRLDYLRRHVVREAARYVNTSGRTVRQIRQESALRDAIEACLDDPGRTGTAAIRTTSAAPCASSSRRIRSSPGRSSRPSGRRLRRARGRRCISSPSRS